VVDAVAGSAGAALSINPRLTWVKAASRGGAWFAGSILPDQRASLHCCRGHLVTGLGGRYPAVGNPAV
jgi:hypothetical protein